MTDGAMSWISLQLALSAANKPASLALQRAPSPLLGKWRTGSATEHVYLWLAHRGRARVWWSREAIVAGTGRSAKSVDWALLFLRSVEAVEITSDPRCGRYHRYRARG
jgi:hypothetical protein